MDEINYMDKFGPDEKFIMMNYFILEDGEPVEASPEEYGEWTSVPGNKRIALDYVGDGEQEYRVSTVFIGCGGIMFETLAHPPNEGERLKRTNTIEEAEEAHREVLKEVKMAVLKEKFANMELDFG